MARFLFLGFFLLPFFSAAQVVDTAMVQKQVDSLIEISRNLIGKREFDKALEVNAVAEQTALEKLGRESGAYGSCCFNRGRVNYFKREYPEAEKWYLESKVIREKVLGKEHPDYVKSLTNLGIVYMDMGNYEKAEPIFLESKAIREKVLGKEHPDYAISLHVLGNLSFVMGNHEKAEQLYLEAKAIREKVLGKEHPEYAVSLMNLGGLYRDMGNYEKAESFLLESKAIWEKLVGKQHPDYVKSLNNLGVLYKNMGNYEKAELILLESKAIREKVLGKQHPDYAFSLNSLGNLYSMMGKYEKAEPLYLESIAIREKVLGKEHLEYAFSLMNLGNLYSTIGNYEKAEPLYFEAIAIKEKVLGKEHPEHAASLHNLGNMYWAMGNYEKAEPLYLGAITISEKVLGKEHPDYADNLRSLGALYFAMGNYEKAKPLYLESKAISEKALGKEHPHYAGSLINLGNFYCRMGYFDKAEPLYLEAKTIQEKVLGKVHPDYANSMHILANLYENQHRFSESEPLLDEYFILSRTEQTKSAAFLSINELANYTVTFRESGDNLLSKILSRQVKKERTGILPGLIYDHALFQKGFLLSAAVRLNALPNASPEITEINNRLKGYRRRLAAEYSKPITGRKNVAELEEKANVAEKELSRRVEGYAEAIRQVKWQEVSAALQPGESAIEFVHFRVNFPEQTDSTMYSALVTLPGGHAPYFIPLCEERQLDALVYKSEGARHNYLQNLYASPRADGLPSLYQLLWSPIEKLLYDQGIKTVYYAPTGLLHRLNLDAIGAGKSGVRLADSYHLVPMGSTRLLAENSKAGTIAEETMPGAATRHSALRTPHSAIVYGGIRYEMDSSAITLANEKNNANPQDTTGGLFSFAHMTEDQRGENWDYLPGTEKEARYLNSLLTGQGIKTNLQLGYEATEESFKQIGQNGPSPSLLHIGTHGFFFPDPQDTTHRRASLSDEEPVFKISEYSMIRSGLKLAGSRYAWKNGHPLPGGHEDGILTAYEVSQMNLSNTQLVVLSACETGLGDIRGNEGVYGLQRAFRIAGAKNVLMSLWKVPDDATEKLMTRFYHNWLIEKKPLQESFEAAQLWLRRQAGFENPYYWAGFVLVK
ncbi:MAG: CHAT domain-containing protein [Phycisphaerae bacterium]|nr:CHAT domain-containing protein [Saprospiraceae bacterium]